MTLSEIYTQQVLNNVAMFVCNPDALPFFAFPKEGTTGVSDVGSLGGIGYTSKNFVTNGLNVNASRTNGENWLLTPISDPAKLALMRCAYQQAVKPCIGDACAGGAQCSDCQKLRRNFYGSEDSEQWQVPCLTPSFCWFQYGCQKHVPKNCSSPYVGSYGDVYVWVPPEGRNLLTQLTLTILNYATNDAVQFVKRTKTVEYYVDQDGNIVSDKDPVADKGSASDKGSVADKGTAAEKGSVADKTSPARIKITATIPIGIPGYQLAVLERESSAFEVRKFGDRFGYGMAQKLSVYAQKTVIPNLVANGETYPDKDDNKKRVPVGIHSARDLEFWAKFGVKEHLWGPDLKDAAEFLGTHGLRPRDIPDASLFAELATKQGGSASLGLQQLNIELKASEGGAPQP
jgi:hypothetical protein